MKVGAERGKLIALVALLGVAAVIWFYQFHSSSATPAAAPPTRSPAREVKSAADDLLDNRAVPKSRTTRQLNDSFKPAVKKTKPGELPEADKIDPTLRTDLLAKVQAVEYQGAERNLFLFGKATPKLTPQQIEKAKKEAAEAEAKLKEPVKPPAPAPPTAPPITMKYYGYANRPGDARKRAFLMDGEDILVATEGEILKKKYKIVRIGINSIVIEDLDFHSQQTLQLQETA